MKKFSIFIILLLAGIFIGCNNTLTQEEVLELKYEIKQQMQEQKLISPVLEDIYLIGKYGDGIMFTPYLSPEKINDLQDKHLGADFESSRIFLWIAGIEIIAKYYNHTPYYYYNDLVLTIQDVNNYELLTEKDALDIKKKFIENDYLITKDYKISDKLFDLCRHLERNQKIKVNPTCIAEGEKLVYCKKCKKTLHTIQIHKELHIYKNGKCVNCNNEKYSNITDENKYLTEILNQKYLSSKFINGYKYNENEIYIYIVEEEFLEFRVKTRNIADLSYVLTPTEEIIIITSKEEIYTPYEAYNANVINKNIIAEIVEIVPSVSQVNEYYIEKLKTMSENDYYYEFIKSMGNDFYNNYQKIYEIAKKYNKDYLDLYKNLIKNHVFSIREIIYADDEIYIIHFCTNSSETIYTVNNIKDMVITPKGTGVILILYNNEFLGLEEAFEKNVISYEKIREIFKNY